eukprot:3562633-Prymnesium_polylepis.1
MRGLRRPDSCPPSSIADEKFAVEGGCQAIQRRTVALAGNGAQQEKVEEIQTLHTDLKLSRKQTVDLSEELIKSSSMLLLL